MKTHGILNQHPIAHSMVSVQIKALESFEEPFKMTILSSLIAII